MASMMEMLTSAIGDDAIGQLGQQLGADPAAVQKGVASALPMLLGGLAKNAASADGAGALAGALDRDHDGSVLDDVTGFLSDGSKSSAAGAGILQHVLGGRRTGAEAAIGKLSGLDAGSAGKLLAMLAPLALGALGKAKREQGLDAGQLGAALGRERDQAAAAQPDAMSMITRLIDSDGDGDITDDVAKIGSQILGMFGKR